MSFSSQVESWRSMAEATHFDASFPLAWIAIESDGEFPHKSSANERGPFEVSWPEANEILHLTRDDFDRIMDDRQYAFDQGIALADYYYYTWVPSHLPWADRWDLYRATKATHAGGMGFAKSLFNFATAFYGRAPANWAEVKTAFSTALSNGSYSDTSGLTHTLPSVLTDDDIGTRVMKQIDKLDSLMGQSSGGSFSPPSGGFAAPSEGVAIGKMSRGKIILGGVAAAGLLYALLRMR